MRTRVKYQAKKMFVLLFSSVMWNDYDSGDGGSRRSSDGGGSSSDGVGGGGGDDETDPGTADRILKWGG